MTPRPPTSILIALLGLGEQLVSRAAAPHQLDQAMMLSTELSMSQASVAGVTVIAPEAHACADLMMALAEALRFGSAARVTKLAMAVGVLLPLVRENLGVALERQKAPAAEAAPDGEPAKFWWQEQ